MNWLVYNTQSFEIVGFGVSASAARLHALENSNMLPSDFGVESWAALDLDAESWGGPDNWATATQERFLEDHEQHSAAVNS